MFHVLLMMMHLSPIYILVGDDVTLCLNQFLLLKLASKHVFLRRMSVNVIYTVYTSHKVEQGQEQEKVLIFTSIDSLQFQYQENTILQRGSKSVIDASLIEPGIDLLVDWVDSKPSVSSSRLFGRQNPGARGTGKVVVLLVSITMIAGNVGRSAGSS